MRRSALRDDQWGRVRAPSPGREGHAGATAGDDRLFVEAGLHRRRAGLPWRDLPERFGDWRHARRRHGRWSKSGVREAASKRRAAEAGNECAMIDSAIVPAHRRTAGAQEKLGRTRRSGAPMDADTLIADKAPDAGKRVIERLAAAGKEGVVPPKASRKVARDGDRDLCKARHLVEDFFAKLKPFRAMATRHDKTARNFLGGVHRAATLVGLDRRHAIVCERDLTARNLASPGTASPPKRSRSIHTGTTK